MPPIISNRLLLRRYLLNALSALREYPTHDCFETQVDTLKQVASHYSSHVLAQIAASELQRLTDVLDQRHLAELMIHGLTLADVQTPLWALIENHSIADNIKDLAHMILNNLGDPSPTTDLLHYLSDPRQLVDRETARMLEVARQNPEALVDFLDFFCSLPFQEQRMLMDVLYEEFSPAFLLQTTQMLLASGLFPTTAALVAQHQDILLRQFSLYDCSLLISTFNHPLLQLTRPDVCYSSLPDGAGNQVIMMVRQFANGDYQVLATVINETGGIYEVFGFYRLSPAEFWKLLDRMHQANHKYPIPAALGKRWLKEALQQNLVADAPIPYEFSAWQVMLADIPEWVATDEHQQALWNQPGWLDASGQLLTHPDLQTWHANPELHAEWSAMVLAEPTSLNLPSTGKLIAKGIEVVTRPAAMAALTHRLWRVALLFDYQGSPVFRDLAYTTAIACRQKQFNRLAKEPGGFLYHYVCKGMEACGFELDVNP